MASALYPTATLGEAMDQEAKSLADLVVQELRTRILDGRLRLGENLSENAVAADLGISKTPVREALLRLKMDRLVDVLPQRGSYVFQLSAEEVAMVSELREVLEIAAAAAAMQRNPRELANRIVIIVKEMRKAHAVSDKVAYATLDGRLHQAIIDLSGNTYIVDAYGPVGFRVQALRARLSEEETLNRRSLQDHCEMLRLVETGQSAALQQLVRKHIRQTAQSSIEMLANNLLVESGPDAGAAQDAKPPARKAAAGIGR
jgi:DNA-binding GntR family transcriptional regulator